MNKRTNILGVVEPEPSEMNAEDQELSLATEDLLSYVMETAPEKYDRVLLAMERRERAAS
jgi:hypothetical protein